MVFILGDHLSPPTEMDVETKQALQDQLLICTSPARKQSAKLNQGCVW